MKMSIPKDDMGMVTQRSVDDLVALEHNPKDYYAYISEVEGKEGGMWYWGTNSREEEIAIMGRIFSELFTHYPTLPIHLNFQEHHHITRFQFHFSMPKGKTIICHRPTPTRLTAA